MVVRVLDCFAFHHSGLLLENGQLGTGAVHGGNGGQSTVSVEVSLFDVELWSCSVDDCEGSDYRSGHNIFIQGDENTARNATGSTIEVGSRHIEWIRSTEESNFKPSGSETTAIQVPSDHLSLKIDSDLDQSYQQEPAVWDGVMRTWN